MTGYKRTKNVATGNIRFYEGRYVQGVVAGLMYTLALRKANVNAIGAVGLVENTVSYTHLTLPTKA